MVVRQRFSENLAVRHVDDSASALVGIYPIPDLDHAELEDSYIYNIPRYFADFNPVSDLKRFARYYEEPSGHIRNCVMHGDRNTGTCQTHKSCQGSDPFRPYRSNQHQQ